MAEPMQRPPSWKLRRASSIPQLVRADGKRRSLSRSDSDNAHAGGVIRQQGWGAQPKLRGTGAGSVTRQPTSIMLNYAVIFLIIAILAGVLGFGVVAGTAATIAKICFVVFLVLFLFSLLGGRTRL
jgi:uncharacterized membrane protein YtjA (UPF0391 family)